jgi:glutamate 5-kinase
MRAELLSKVARLVVKLGTGILTDARRQPDPEQMERLVSQLAAQQRSGKEVVLVTSGAVGAGMGLLGYAKRPTEVAELQACAAVGQFRLMGMYEKLFAKYSLHAAQVLVTHEDLEDHDRHLNARNTLVSLLRHGVIPIINENDAVSFTELKFGDNDKLSALVACLLPADLLVILTSVDGLVENFGTPAARIVRTVEQIDSALEKMAGGTSSATSVGGMSSKIEAAKIAVSSGIPMVVASGLKKDVLERLLSAEEEGTLFIPKASKMRGRKRWIAFFHHPKGTLVVDEGARKALREQNKSLLPPGISHCEGEFSAGEIVRICDLNGTEFARGIARFDGRAIQSRQLPRSEVVHRDDLVIL